MRTVIGNRPRITHYVRKGEVLTFRHGGEVEVVDAFGKVVMYRSNGVVVGATAAHFVETSVFPGCSRGSFRLECSDS